MKIKLLSALLLLSFQLCFSQNIKGKVMCNSYIIPNVEVINSFTKKLTTTDAEGNFSIDAKTNDLLVFVSKEHQLKKLTINPLLFINNELIVELTLNAEELNEVVVTNMPSIKLSKDDSWEQTKLDQYTLEKRTAAPKVQGVYTGELVNGVDFMRIGGMLLSLFIKDKEPAKKEPAEVLFKDFVKSHCNQSYFEKTLDIKPEKIGLFMEFCDADPRSKSITTSKNVLTLMDFLLEKKTAFKKL
ncbi:hypothetical protein HNP99_002392 [Flavobacterium sp. 28A]|uniref:hypothetical protein n=1 Tax=Flavobacterium sp. 28A TaxID=2735895 RepID=UPI00156F481A|nr:hypothetical protein [Flavobacterium sp. 28A]NRT16030.1 hypothetical protein [Flavobacterium sp. 28A]